MSNRKEYEALLNGQKPHFPAILAKAQKRTSYHLERLTEQFLDGVAEELAIDLPEGVHPPVVSYYRHTSDGYLWFGQIPFWYRGMKFKVMIPRTMDSRGSNKTFADRHIAIYATQDGVSRELLLQAATVFVKAFDAMYKRLYYGAIKNSKTQRGVISTQRI